jgi:hypothetical protein
MTIAPLRSVNRSPANCFSAASNAALAIVMLDVAAITIRKLSTIAIPKFDLKSVREIDVVQVRIGELAQRGVDAEIQFVLGVPIAARLP